MKKFLKYYKEHKGMSLVWITLLLFVLLVFAAMAVDISYMYNVKNQLTVAADAAVLAGVKELAGGTDGPTADLVQADARQEAWKFACKNEAANRHVFLVIDNGVDPFGPNTDCDSPPSGSALDCTNEYGRINHPDCDIVVGHWEETPFTCNAPLRTGVTNPVNFCPADGVVDPTDPSLDSINAIQAYPRKTEESPNGAAELFLGQVFKVIGRDWSFMSAQAQAIASYDFAGNASITVCFQTCNWNELHPENPVTPETPILLYWAPYPSEIEPGQGIAWTVFDEESPSTPTQEVIEYFCKESPDVCYKTIHSDNGAADAAQQAFRCAFYNPLYDTRGKTCADGTCDSETDTVTEWRIIVPVFSEEDENPCPPGNEPYAKTVERYAEITITDVYSSRSAATTNCACDDHAAPRPDPSLPNAIVVTGIRCVDCDDLGDLGVGEPKLVR